jgi:hypothetical protein
MFASNRIFPAFIVLLLVTIACSGPAISTADPNLLGTSVAQTAFVAFTLSAQASSATPIVQTATLTLAPTFTFTPEPPTLTPTSTLTPTPSSTPTPAVPLISVSVPTNCRSGPGKVYDYRGALLVGEITEVVARDATGNYWYVRNPDSAGNFCWLWGNYATISGNISVLPIYTPPPTPTPTFTPTPSPSFRASYTSLDTCGTNWWLDIRIRNNGSISFKSVDISVRDTVSNVEVVDLSDGFTDIDGCVKTTTKDVIAPGDTYLLSSPPFTYNPTGHDIRVVLTLCSETGQKGTCLTDKFNVTP